MIKLLDCTLRDGGYVNDWLFGIDNIKSIISNLNKSNIDIIECGYLDVNVSNDKNKSIYSDFRFIKEILIDNIDLQKEYVMMIDYKKLCLDKIEHRKNSFISGIRLAFHKKDMIEALKSAEKLQQKGYDVFVQPMVTMSYGDEELLDLIRITNSIMARALYIVDSFGAMQSNDLKRIFSIMDHNLNKNIDIGYHSHNNMQLAFSNAQHFINYKKSRNIIIDSSVYGMGRGAGNLNTEIIADYLNVNYDKELQVKYDVVSLLDIIDDSLNREYKNNYWGYSLPHYLSSYSSCHPNYATFLSKKNTLSVSSIRYILDGLDEEKKLSFDLEYIEQEYIRYQKEYGCRRRFQIDKLRERLKDKQILIVCPGNTLSTHHDKIEIKSNNKDIITISVNFIPDMLDVDYAFFGNEKRYNQLYKKLNNCNPSAEDLIVTSNVRNCEGLLIDFKELVNENTVVGDNSTIMLLKLLDIVGAKDVYIAGFDGYSSICTKNYFDDNMDIIDYDEDMSEKNRLISNELRVYMKKLNIEFLTPSAYQRYINLEGER